jgi:hypothetical protein
MVFSAGVSQADAITSQFGPGSSTYTPPNGLISLPGVNAPCLSTASGQLNNGIQQIGSILGGKSSGLGTKGDGCSLGGAIPTKDEYTCATLASSTPAKTKTDKNGDDITVPGKDPALDPLTALLNGTNACSSAVQTLQSEVTNCLQPAESQMNSQLEAFSSSFGQALNQAKAAVATQKLKEADVKNQMDFIDLQLKGDGSGGNTDNGLIGMQTRLENAVNSMDANTPMSYGQVRAVEASGQALVQTEASISAQIVRTAMQSFQSCFNTPQNNLRCSPQGQPVSPQQYMLCAFNSNGNFVNGVYDQNTITQGNSNANTAGLSNLVSTLFNNIPNSMQNFNWNSTAATTALQSGQVTAFYFPTILSTIQSQLGTVGASYGAGVQSFISQEVQTCAAMAQSQTASSEANPGGPGEADPKVPATTIGSAEYKLKQQMTDNQTQFNALTQAYSTEWAKDAGILWPGSYNPSNVLASAGCVNASLANQSSCLESLHTALQGILTGAGQTPVTLSIPTNYPGGETGVFGTGGTAITCSGANATATGGCQCSGVIGCVQMYQNVRKERQQYYVTLQTQQQTYASSATSYLNGLLTGSQGSNGQAATGSSTQVASQIAQSMRSQVQSIAQKLSSEFGLATSITVPAVIPGKALGPASPPPDGDGLPTLPDGGAKSLLASVDLTQSLQDINNALGDATKKVAREKTDLTNLIAYVTAKEASCSQTTDLKNLDKSIQRFTGACAGRNNISACPTDDGDSSTIQVLRSTISDINSAVLSVDSDSAASLASNDVKALQGMIGSCITPDPSAANKACSSQGCAPITGPDSAATCQAQFSSSTAATMTNGQTACTAAISKYLGSSNAQGVDQDACQESYNDLKSAKDRFDTAADKKSSAGSGDIDPP